MTTIKINDAYLEYSVSDMDDKELVLEKVYVPENKRQQGIGTKLVQKFIDICQKENKNGGLAIYSDDDYMSNEQLHDWYQSLGFKDVESDIMIFKIN